MISHSFFNREGYYENNYLVILTHYEFVIRFIGYKISTRRKGDKRPVAYDFYSSDDSVCQSDQSIIKPKNTKHDQSGRKNPPPPT